MTDLTNPFEYSLETVAHLESALSPERFQTYVNRAGGRRIHAIRLYERNTALSAALYCAVQGAEIALRNTIHKKLSEVAGPIWFNTMKLEEAQRAMVDDAKAEVKKAKGNVTACAVVAGLSLGFWTALLSRRYDSQLWVPHLFKAFPHAWREIRDEKGRTTKRRISRADVYDQFDKVRYLRNRIAHHEPIIQLDLQRYYDWTLETLSWICPYNNAWIQTTNRFPHIFGSKPKAATPSIALAHAAPPMPGKPAPADRRASSEPVATGVAAREP